MHIVKTQAALVFAAVVGAGVSMTFAADESLRSLAEERGRYIGAILNSEWFNNGLGGDAASYEEIHSGQFNAVVAENEMKFDATEPSENKFNYTKGDKLVAYAQKNGMRVRGHALAWHSQVPGWVTAGMGKEKLLKVLKNHIDSVVTHYKGKVHEWDVVNEAINDGDHTWRSEGSVWYQGVGSSEFIDSAFVWAHAADPDAELCYNDYAIEWGVNDGSKAGFLLKQVDRWIQNKIPITCVGTQTHIEISHEYTPANVRTLAKELAKRGIRLNITELDIGFPQGSAGSLGAADYAKQGHLYRQFMDVFLEEENMGEFMIWGVSDKYSWLDGQQGKTQGLIYDKNFMPKPAYDSLIASLKAHDVASVKPANYGQTVVRDTTVTSAFGNGVYTIVDYSVAAAGSWSGDTASIVPELSPDGKSMKIPQAGCEQSECGYQHAIYTLPDEAVAMNVLSVCENLMLTWKSLDDATAYINVGFNSPWESLENGRPVKGTEWGETSVALDAVRENSATPTQLTFNSEGKGFYIQKIQAVGCPDKMSVVKRVARKNIGFTMAGKMLHMAEMVNLEIYDLQGQLMMKRNSVRGMVDLKSMNNGIYIIRIRNATQSLTRRIILK